VLLRLGVSIIVASVLLAWGAAGAANPRRAAFEVTLTGTLTKEWTVKRTVEGGCEEVTTNAGHWKVALATRRPSRVVILAPSRRGGPVRITPGVLRSIAGTASQTGTTRVDSRGTRCVRSVQMGTCEAQRRSFRGATVRLTSPIAGRARFARLQRASAVRSFRRTCPEEPADIRNLRTELTLADGVLDASYAFDRDVPRFFSIGNSEQETTIEGEYDGKVTERVRWKVTFTRIR
jgi:hypothetical protein